MRGLKKPDAWCVYYGHCCSTRNVLHACNISNVLTDAPVYAKNGNINLSRDAKMRFTTFPNGTHKLSLCSAILDSLWTSAVLFLIPNPNDFTTIAETVKKVKSDPAHYYIGAYYLTGNQRVDYDDSDRGFVAGRLGTFARTNYKNSTLVKPPHHTNEKVESYDDFDGPF